jgi:hypothetical protein
MVVATGRPFPLSRYEGGNAGAFGEVVDGNFGQGTLVEQALRGCQDRPFAVITRQPGAAAPVAETAMAGGGNGHDSSLSQILTDYQ